MHDAAGVFTTRQHLWRGDRWHFTLATWIKVCWACAAIFNFVTLRGTAPPGLWGIAGLYCGLAALVFIITGWRERPIQVAIVHRVVAKDDDS